MAAGLTTIRKAHYANTGIYTNAFFQLTIGLERILKLILVVDFMLDNGGGFPDDKYVRAKGHSLLELIKSARDVANRRSLKVGYAYPDDPITDAIVDVLTEFATATRYYNLDYLTGGKSKDMSDPLKAWYERVGALIFEKHHSAKKRDMEQARAKAIAGVVGDVMSIRFTREDGRPIDTAEAMFSEGPKVELLQKWGQFYCVRLVRYFAVFLSELGREAWGKNEDVPYFSYFFRVFSNDDAYIKSVKTWKII